MKTMYYSVVDCEHEGDVNHAISEMRDIADFDLISTDYDYEDDEDEDADHEICGCTIVFKCDDKFVDKFKKFGAYCW